MENVNVFDIVVVALIVLLGLKGLFRGITKELFGIIGIVGGVFIASRLANEVGEVVNSIIPMDNENTILLSGFVAALVVFWVIAYILGLLVSKMFSLSGLGVFDKIFGFVFGAGKIFLLFSIIAYATTQVKFIDDNIKPKLKDSMMFPILADSGSYIIKLDTGEVQQTVSKQFDSVVEATKDTIKEISKEELEKRAVELKKQLEETSGAK